MKRMKKIFAVILSLAMVMGMSLTAFAANPVSPDETAAVTVKGVVEGATLKAYQIITYDNKGEFIVKKVTKVGETNPSPVIADPETPSAAEINALPGYVSELGSPVENGWTYDSTAKTYTNQLGAGMWLILISGTNEVIYQPLIASVNVGTDGNLIAGGVDANGQYTGQLEAKSNPKPVVEKTTFDQTFEKDKPITFNVVAQIPQYDARYTSVKYQIKDKLSSNLEFDTNSVKIEIKDSKIADEALKTTELTNNTEINTSSNVVFNAQDRTMTINIPSNIVLANKGKYIYVRYQAKLTDDAKNTLASATETSNNVEVSYSNDPGNSNSTTSQEDDTKEYTFGINAGLVGGEASPDFKKVDETEKEAGTENLKALSGATFALYESNTEDATAIQTNTTDENGLAAFTGLKANKVYYLRETKAPSGYSVRNDFVPVYIDATYANDGKTLASYTIKIGGKVVASGDDLENDGENVVRTGSYTWTADQEGSTADTDNEAYEFKDTKLSSLPSTGGIGTTIFTIGGCAIMIIAAALFFASRRKSAK